MPVFERYFASVPLTPQRLPRAPARELADTGQGIEAAAVAELGRGLTGTAAVLFKWDQREGNSQYDTARGTAQNLIGEFERTTFTNSTEHDSSFKKLEAAIAKSAGKNKSGARKFKVWVGLNKAPLDKLSAEKKMRMIARNGQVALFQNLTNVAKDYTDPIAAKKRINTLIQGALDDGSIKTADQALSLKKRFIEDWSRADVWRRATATVRPDGEVNWQAAADWFDVKENIVDLPENIVEDFANTARANARAQKAEDTEVRRAAQEAQRLEIVKELRPGGDMKNAARLVAASDLPAAEQGAWDIKIEARAAAINGGKDDPMNQTTPAKYFELRRRIETLGDVTEAELAAVVGRGGGLEFVLPTPEQQKKDARTGELGQIGNSSEISITVTDPRLNAGKATNIPTLVKGQIEVEELARTLQPTDEQQEIAIKRAVDRVSAGATLPSFDSIETAVKAAGERSDAKGMGGGISIDDYEKLLAMTKDKDDPLNAPSVKRGQDTISRLRARIVKLAEDDEDPAGRSPADVELDFLRIQNEFDQWVRDNPKATDADKEKKVRTLSEPEAEEIVNGFFEKLLGLFIIGTGGRGLGFGERRGGITATNPKTGKKVISFDGGETWRPL